ncbi:MAG: hypothetical protein IJO59_01675 [Clostridia bacterium]|nr:hypothetical protein [Clostridia bacterium]
MKNLKKVFSAVLVVAMLFSAMSLCVGAASTPAAQTIEALPGETVTIRLCESDCYGISGDITYDNRDLFSSLTPGTSPYGQVREKKFILSSADKIECEVVLTAKISDTAAVGSQCVITFGEYIRVDNNVTLEGPDDLKKTVTVKVIAKASDATTTTKDDTTTTTTTKDDTTPSSNVGGDTTPSSGASGDTTGSTTKGDVPAGATTTKGGASAATTTKGGASAATTTKGGSATATTTKPPATGEVDLTELNKQIGIAEALKQDEYTRDTWNDLMSALGVAKAAREANNQAAVDKAAQDLKQAIAALRRIDKQSLSELIEKIEELFEKDEMGSLLERLMAAYEKALAALKSGSQEDIVAAFRELQDALDAYNAYLDDLSKGEVIYVDKPVEVMPSDPFCNIWLHKLWPILLIVSVILNLGFIGLIVYYFVRRKQNLADNTPMVVYDIDEDAPLDGEE